MKSRIILIIIGLTLVLLGVKLYSPNKLKENIQVLTKKTQVQNAVKIIAKPKILYHLNQVAIDLSIISFQNSVIFEEDPKDISFIMINSATPIQPTDFILSSENEYERTGQLTFIT